jgi:hypothetical protein
MKLVLSAIALLAMVTWIIPGAWAQEADTIRVGSDRVVIVIDDGSILFRSTDEWGNADERELRVGRGERPSDLRILRRNGGESDTLSFDVQRLVERARGLNQLSRRWVEDFEFPELPLGERLEERRDLVRMETEANALARRTREARGEERQRLEAELRSRLDDLLSRRLELERSRVDRLESQASERRERLNYRMENRGEILERRMRDLLGNDDLEW